jgi:hypothetical protein
VNAVVYETTPTLNRAEIVELYEAVGWSAYTKDPSRLAAAVSASLAVVTARRDDGRLIGLARLVGDGLTIVYLQDIRVRWFADVNTHDYSLFIVFVLLNAVNIVINTNLPLYVTETLGYANAYVGVITSVSALLEIPLTIAFAVASTRVGGQSPHSDRTPCNRGVPYRPSFNIEHLGDHCYAGAEVRVLRGLLGSGDLFLSGNDPQTIRIVNRALY